MKKIKQFSPLFIGVFIFVLFCVGIFTIFPSVASPAIQSQQWTIQTLKEHYDYVLKQRDEKMDQKFASLELAVSVANAELEKRLDNTNEWRASQDDLIKSMKENYAPKGELTTLQDQVDKIEKKQNDIESMREGGSSTIAWIAAGIGLFLALIALSKNFISAIFQKTK